MDNKSRYYWDVIDFLRKRKFTIVSIDPLRFDLRKLKHENILGVILTGGGDFGVDRKREFNFRVIRLFKNKPLLGICLGHEFLVEFHKGGLYQMNWRARGLSYVNIIKNNELVKGKRRLLVYKGHGFAAGIIPDSFEQLAWSSDCENEMIKHEDNLHFGVQFHPEKSSEGKIVLDNFLRLCER